MEERIKQVMADILGVDPDAIDGATSMQDIESWDSANHISLCLGLEEAFQIQLDVSDMEAMVSYDDILHIVTSKR